MNLCENSRMKLHKRLLLQLLTPFFLILFWRIFVLWRGQINVALWQDEISWAQLAQINNLWDYVWLRDSGYPVPLARFLMWFIVHGLNGSTWIIHLSAALIAALSSSSLILILRKQMHVPTLTLAALIVGFFPSFDLLLFHNSSYFVFVPIVALLLLRISQRQFSFFDSLTLTALISFCTKPQLLFSILVGFTFLCLTNRKQIMREIKNVVVPIVATVWYLVLGRLHQESIDLDLNIRSLYKALFAIIYIPGAVYFPGISVAMGGYARLSNSTLIWCLSILIVILFSILISCYSIVKLYLGSPRDSGIFLSSIAFLITLPTYFSLFIFPNSGWQHDYFWNDTCTVCLYQRHWLPIVFLTLLNTLVLFYHSKFLKFLFAATLFQVISLALVAYPYLYQPI